MRSAARPVLLVGWIVALAAVLLGALAIGPALPMPAHGDEWLAAHTPAEAVVAVGRLVVVALATYLLAVTLAMVAAALLDAGRALSVLDVAAVPAVQAVVRAGLGLGVAGAAVVAVAPRGAAPSPGPTVADVALVADVAIDEEPPVLRRVAPEPAPVAAPEARTWTVAPGDHFWSIASRVLTDAWGRSPRDGEVLPYWNALVEHNRTRLADRANADLLFPGQVLLVPTPPPSP